eukprot:2121369-Pleurochrysis_carterae.AAC.1
MGEEISPRPAGSRLWPGGMTLSPSGCARSRTGGGLQSEEKAAEKHLETEIDEHGGEAKIAR